MSCSDCPLHQTSKCNCLPGQGPLNARIMLIGESPGATEEATGNNFVGESGIVLNELLQKAGVDRKEVFVCNVVRCRPPKDHRYTKVEIQACRKYVIEDIKKVNPEVVVLLGAVALDSILGVKGIEKNRGFQTQSNEFPGVVFFPTYHPAMLLRKWEPTEVLIGDLRKAVNGKPTCSLTQYESLTDVGRAVEILTDLRKQSLVVYDTETTGFDWISDSLLCIGFGCVPGQAFVLPIYKHKLQPVWDSVTWPPVWQALQNLFESPEAKGGQNLMFDMRFLRSLKIEPNGFIYDSMLMHHLLDENNPHGLDFFVSQFTDLPPYFRAANPYKGKKKVNMADMPDDELWQYNACDVDATLRSIKIFEPRLKQEGLWNLYSQIVEPLIRTLNEATWHGTVLDMEMMQKLQVQYLEKVEKSREEICELGGVEFNPGSFKQLQRVLFQMLGLKGVKQTATGWSTDDESLKKMRGQHPIVKKITDYRNVRKFIGTYLSGMDGESGILKQVSKDGKIHTTFKIHGTVTGRLSSGIHNYPKKGDIRGLHRGPEGNFFVGADYEQGEIRVLAHIAGDVELQAALDRGEDVHSQTAELMYRLPKGSVVKGGEKDDIREKAKFISHGLNYGRTAFGIAKQLGIAVTEAEKLIQLYFAARPKVKLYFKRQEKLVDAGGVIKNSFGRIRRLFGAKYCTKERIAHLSTVNEQAARRLADFKKELYRQSYNFPIQSDLRDVLSQASNRIRLELEKRKMKSRLCIDHHDALYYDCPPEELYDFIVLMLTEMQRPVPQLGNIVFPAELSVGVRWGDKSLTDQVMAECKKCNLLPLK